MAELGFDPFNPPQLSRQDRAVAGCDCGGLDWHAEACSIWAVDRAVAQQAIDDARARMVAHTEMLTASLRRALGGE